MRLLLAAVTVVLPLAVSTGCGTEAGTGTVATTATTPSGSASPSEATASPGTSSTVQAYSLLAEESTRFVAAAQAIDGTNPDAYPRTVEEALALVDYTFADGVALSVFDDDGYVCFTGPEETFLSLSESVAGELRQVLGTGECAYDDGDVVLEIVFRPGSSLRVEERVLKGEDIVEQIPAIDGFVEVLNEAFAGSGVPEGDATASGADQ